MDTMDFIESYFNQTLSEEERSEFERRCVEDTAFAHDVAFYVAARESLRENLLQQKQTTWQQNKVEEEPFIPRLKRSFTSRWISYAAAACLVLAVSVYLFETNSAPSRLADNFIKSNYNTLSQNMSADSDALALGKTAYNEKKYDDALSYFKSVEQHDGENSEAKQYTGLAYLQKDEYDSAIKQFDELSSMRIFSNPGDFLKAVSLMKRNKPGDKEKAKLLLQKVISQREEYIEQARDWEKKL